MLMLAAMALAAAERRPRRLIAIGAVFGAVQGLGFGMRTDVALNFVPFFIVLFAAAAFGIMRSLRCAAGVRGGVARHVRRRRASDLQVYARDSSLWHVVLLGFTVAVRREPGYRLSAAAYSFPYAHNDSYIETVVRATGLRHPSDPPLMVLTRPYDRACQDYFFRWPLTFRAT